VIGVQHGDRPRQQQHNEVGKEVAKHVLQERPGAVPEVRVPASNHEVEHLLAAAKVEPDRRSKGGMIPQPIEVPEPQLLDVPDAVGCMCAILRVSVGADRRRLPRVDHRISRLRMASTSV
jgi:hypothetical protein